MATKANGKAQIPKGKAPPAKSGKQSFAAAKPSGGEKGKAKAAEKEDDSPKRALGLRGAAPWAARHAAKHAAEARKRAAEPPPPGSARATIRTPSGVEEIKQQISELHNTCEKLKALRRNLPKTFFDVGLLLREIQTRKLYAAKGFQSFESFIEREIDLGKTVVTRLVKLVSLFQREAALEMGMERTMETLIHLEGGPEAAATSKQSSDSRLPAAKPPPSNMSKPPIVGRLPRHGITTSRRARKPPFPSGGSEQKKAGARMGAGLFRSKSSAIRRLRPPQRVGCGLPPRSCASTT